MNAENFLDTNIFVYLFDETDDYQRERAERLVQQVLENETGCISYQVVQETLNVVIQKLNATPEKARQVLDHALIPLWRVNPRPGRSINAASNCKPATASASMTA